MFKHWLKRNLQNKERQNIYNRSTLPFSLMLRPIPTKNGNSSNTVCIYTCSHNIRRRLQYLRQNLFIELFWQSRIRKAWRSFYDLQTKLRHPRDHFTTFGESFAKFANQSPWFVASVTVEYFSRQWRYHDVLIATTALLRTCRCVMSRSYGILAWWRLAALYSTLAGLPKHALRFHGAIPTCPLAMPLRCGGDACNRTAWTSAFYMRENRENAILMW